jgi:hypothetical protein
MPEYLLMMDYFPLCQVFDDGLQRQAILRELVLHRYGLDVQHGELDELVDFQLLQFLAQHLVGDVEGAKVVVNYASGKARAGQVVQAITKVGVARA